MKLFKKHIYVRKKGFLKLKNYLKRFYYFSETSYTNVLYVHSHISLKTLSIDSIFSAEHIDQITIF